MQIHRQKTAYDLADLTLCFKPIAFDQTNQNRKNPSANIYPALPRYGSTGLLTADRYLLTIEKEE